MRPEPIGQPVKLFCCRVVHGVLSLPVRVFSLRRSAVCRVACCGYIIACVQQLVNMLSCSLDTCTISDSMYCAFCTCLHVLGGCAIMWPKDQKEGDKMSTDAKRASNARYLAKQKTVTVRMPPEAAGRIRQAAEAAGESVNAYILQACAERMQRDQDQ